MSNRDTKMIDDGTGLRERHVEALREMLDGRGPGASFTRKQGRAALTAAIAALSTVAPPPVLEGMGWIPVSERLPTEEDYADYGDVLVRYRYTKGGRGAWDVGESFHDPEHKHNGGWLFGSCYHAKVSHWMPKSHLVAASPAAPAQPPTGALLAAVNRMLDYADADYVPNVVFAQLLQARDKALSAAQPEGGEAAEDRFEQFVAAGIANSPEPLRELGEYLSRVLDEDKFPAADHLLLQLATSYTRPAPAQQAVTDEMKELLHSTHEIALRGGADTDWEALAKSIAKLGIGPITARHYFAEGTSREAKDKHLDALLSRVNAARRAALAHPQAAGSAPGEAMPDPLCVQRRSDCRYPKCECPPSAGSAGSPSTNAAQIGSKSVGAGAAPVGVDAKDAARYRHMRRRLTSDDGLSDAMARAMFNSDPWALDAAIDAALEKERAE